MDTITPCLWFDGKALDAAEFYVALFPNSKIGDVSRLPDGTPLMVAFELNGAPFQALNGGPQFTFNEAISLSIPCESQEEADHFWAALSADGEEGNCGWLKDRFGVSWQVVPQGIGEILGDPDPGRAARAMQAMMGMKRLDLAALRAAADAS